MHAFVCYISIVRVTNSSLSILNLFEYNQFQSNMRPLWRNIQSINAIFFILFITHLSIICYQSLNPNVPSIRVFKEDLHKIDFPINFKVCVHELENITARYQKVGYPHSYFFYIGIREGLKKKVGNFPKGRGGAFWFGSVSYLFYLFLNMAEC